VLASAPSKNVAVVEQKLLKVLPAEFKVDVYHWLITHGRYACIARKPSCGSCIIDELCDFSQTTLFSLEFFYTQRSLFDVCLVSYWPLRQNIAWRLANYTN
jgi:adenine-specific DNA glycosylase